MSFLSELLIEINKVRTNPSSYADKIDGYKQYFTRKILKLPNSNIGISTEEGPDAYDECAKFLRSTNPVCEQIASKGLSRIANELLVVAQRNPSEVYQIDCYKLVDKYGYFEGGLSRIIECGGMEPEQVVINILVSDGDKKRSQRNTLLNKNLKKVGLASGKHDVYGIATALIFSGNFHNSYDSDDSEHFGEVKNNYSNLEQNKKPIEAKINNSSELYYQKEPQYQKEQIYQKNPQQYQYQTQPQYSTQQQYQTQQDYQAQNQYQNQPQYQTKSQYQSQSDYQKQQQYQTEPKYQADQKNDSKNEMNMKNKMKNQNQEYHKSQEQKKENGNQDIYLVCEEKIQKVIFEGGKKKNKITIAKYYSDGHVENDVKIEPLSN